MVIWLLASCGLLPELPDLSPDFREPAEPIADCETYCTSPFYDYTEPEWVADCVWECEVGLYLCPDEVHGVWDCLFVLRTEAVWDSGGAVTEWDCYLLQSAMGASCGVDMIPDTDVVSTSTGYGWTR